MKIQQCFLELQLKMSGMFFLRHTVVYDLLCTRDRPWLEAILDLVAAAAIATALAL